MTDKDHADRPGGSAPIPEGSNPPERTDGAPAGVEADAPESAKPAPAAEAPRPVWLSVQRRVTLLIAFVGFLVVVVFDSGNSIPDATLGFIVLVGGVIGELVESRPWRRHKPKVADVVVDPARHVTAIRWVRRVMVGHALAAAFWLLLSVALLIVAARLFSLVSGLSSVYEWLVTHALPGRTTPGITSREHAWVTMAIVGTLQIALIFARTRWAAYRRGYQQLGQMSEMAASSRSIWVGREFRLSPVGPCDQLIQSLLRSARHIAATDWRGSVRRDLVTAALVVPRLKSYADAPAPVYVKSEGAAASIEDFVVVAEVTPHDEFRDLRYEDGLPPMRPDAMAKIVAAAADAKATDAHVRLSQARERFHARSGSISDVRRAELDLHRALRRKLRSRPTREKVRQAAAGSASLCGLLFGSARGYYYERDCRKNYLANDKFVQKARGKLPARAPAEDHDRLEIRSSMLLSLDAGGWRVGILVLTAPTPSAFSRFHIELSLGARAILAQTLADLGSDAERVLRVPLPWGRFRIY